MVTSAGLYLILLASIKPFSVHSTDTQGDFWSWSWVCTDGNCVRTSEASADPAASFSSLTECRLKCSDYSTLWPRPTGKFIISRETVEIHAKNFKFDLSGVTGTLQAQEFVANSTNNLIESLMVECPGSKEVGTKVTVTVITLSSDLTLDWNTDESYMVAINNTGKDHLEVLIKSQSVYGARHGLETLSQLAACQSDEVNTLIMIDKATVTDKPAYPHRGLLLDTARTFLSVETIMRTLKGMAASKMNVFHWHMTDTHSFPYFSPRQPQLSRFGAYSSREIYMPEDVKKIINFANSLGIRVILEIDAPAHAGNGWQWGEAEGMGKMAVCVDQQPWREYCVQPPCGQLNPTNPRVFHVLKQLYRDIQDSFPPDMFHMGGDEVHFPCWLSVPEIVTWMKSHGLNMTDDGFLELWSRFQDQSLSAWDEVAGHKLTPIILWSSHLTEPSRIEKYLDNERYVIETWVDKSDDSPLELLAKGYGLIMATKDAWYLDHGFWGNTLYHKWNDVYDNRLPEAKLGVYGGEACMWGEMVGDTNIDAKVWPRAACVGERLWSDPDTPSSQALPRLLHHTGRLNRRGIDPEVIVPEWCSKNDGQC